VGIKQTLNSQKNYIIFIFLIDTKICPFFDTTLKHLKTQQISTKIVSTFLEYDLTSRK